MLDNLEKPGQEKPELTPRMKIRLDRLARIAKTKIVPRVRVSPRDDDVRAIIKHPRAGAFRSSGSLEWPNDTFTQRRLRDGTVVLEPPRNGNGNANTKAEAEASGKMRRHRESRRRRGLARRL